MTSTEVKFDGEAVQRVFGVPRDVIKGTVVEAMDVMEERKSEGLVAIRRPDEISNRTGTGAVGLDGENVANPDGQYLGAVGSTRKRAWRQRAEIPASPSTVGFDYGTGKCFPALTPETTVIAWGVRGTGEVNLEVRSLVETPVVRGLVTLAVMDDMGEMMLDRLGDRAERLSEAFRRAFDDRAIKLLGTCACSWMSEKLGDEFEEWWNEGGGWRALYRVVRESELVESTVKERTGIEPGK
ncbi:hypothetical protein [Methanopyrus sp.]